jgi:hypothetical protein
MEMNEERFKGTWCSLGTSRNRRGALAALAGLSLAAMAHPAGSRKKTRRKGRQRTVSAASVSGGDLVAEGVSDATSIEVYAYYDWWTLWDHTDLTATVHAGGNADPALVARIREAISIWGDALDRHFGGLVTLTDVTDDHERAVQADMRIHFIPHWSGWRWGGMAVCGDDKCNNIYVKSEWPPSACCKDLINDEFAVTPELAGQIALHELGHALGLGHAAPLTETNDIMGYGFAPWITAPPREPVISACDLKAFDAIFAWKREGTEPRRPAISEVVCRA